MTADPKIKGTEMGSFWKGVSVAAVPSILVMLGTLFQLYGDFTVLKEDITKIRQGNIGMITDAPTNVPTNTLASGTLLSEAIGTRKNLEEVRKDIREIRGAVESLDQNIADIKQKFVFNMVGEVPE